MSSAPIPAPPPDASSSQRGLVNTGAQTFAGNKTFTGTVAAANVSGSTSGTNTGDVSIGTANGLSLTGQAISLAPAVASGSAGALTGADKAKLDGITGTNTGDVSLGAVGAVPNANGASLAGQVLTLQPANSSNPGVVTTGAQTWAGAKTFSATIHSGAADLTAMLQADNNGAFVNFSPADNYSYIRRSGADNLRIGGGSAGQGALTVSGTLQALHYLELSDFTDDSANTGSRTVNKTNGISAFAAGTSSITITNNKVSSTSRVLAVLQTNDATAVLKNVVPATGSFTINLTANCTGTTKVAWVVIIE